MDLEIAGVAGKMVGGEVHVTSHHALALPAEGSQPASSCKAKSGVPACTCHDAQVWRLCRPRHSRHSAATYLAREGATEQQLKAIGGWKPNVVSRYVHLAAEHAKVVLERMNAKFIGNGVAENGTEHDR